MPFYPILNQSNPGMNTYPMYLDMPPQVMPTGGTPLWVNPEDPSFKPGSVNNSSHIRVLETSSPQEKLATSTFGLPFGLVTADRIRESIRNEQAKPMCTPTPTPNNNNALPRLPYQIQPTLTNQPPPTPATRTGLNVNINTTSPHNFQHYARFPQNLILPLAQSVAQSDQVPNQYHRQQQSYPTITTPTPAPAHDMQPPPPQQSSIGAGLALNNAIELGQSPAMMPTQASPTQGTFTLYKSSPPQSEPPFLHHSSEISSGSVSSASSASIKPFDYNYHEMMKSVGVLNLSCPVLVSDNDNVNSTECESVGPPSPKTPERRRGLTISELINYDAPPPTPPGALNDMESDSSKVDPLDITDDKSDRPFKMQISKEQKERMSDSFVSKIQHKRKRKCKASDFQEIIKPDPIEETREGALELINKSYIEIRKSRNETDQKENARSEKLLKMISDVVKNKGSAKANLLIETTIENEFARQRKVFKEAIEQLETPAVKTKDSLWVCTLCSNSNITYNHYKHLLRHAAIHLHVKAFKCPFCPKRFRRSDTARRHHQTCKKLIEVVGHDFSILGGKSQRANNHSTEDKKSSTENKGGSN